MSFYVIAEHIEAMGGSMTNGYQDILFFVFTGFFVLIGLASLSVLLGFPRKPDERFRRWAIPGFLAGVTTAVFGLFKFVFLTAMAPIIVTLVPPSATSAPILTSGMYQYDEIAGDKKTVITRSGSVVPVLGEGSWQVELPGEVSNKAIRLHFEDENGGQWDAGPFFANYVKQAMRVGKAVRTKSANSWRAPGIALVFAAEAIREPSFSQGTAIRFNNYARRTGDQSGRPYYEWRVFVDEPQATLQKIAQVDYVLHPTFPDPFKSSQDRGKQFELVASGWGEFTIMITVHFTNGEVSKSSYSLDLRRGWPVSDRASIMPSAQMKLDKIHVDWDGSPGTTGWIFDVLIDGRHVLHLPNREYDDSRSHKGRKSDYQPTGQEWLISSVRVTGTQDVRVEVNGKRSFGGDTATGTGTLRAGQQSVEVNVLNKRDPKNGSFIFYFTRVPI